MFVDGWVSASDAVRKALAFRWWTSGSPAIDGLLGGGFREGRVIEVHGRSGSGKSQLAMQTVLSAARLGAKTLYVDSEGAFRPERLQSMAEARGWKETEFLDRIGYVRTDSSSEQMDLVRRMSKRDSTAQCRVVVVDTLTRSFALEMPGRTNAPARQGALDLHLSEMSRDAYLNSRAYVVTDRVTFGQSGDTMIGGRTVRQLVHASVTLERVRDSVYARIAGGGTAQGLLDARGIN